MLSVLTTVKDFVLGGVNRLKRKRRGTDFDEEQGEEKEIEERSDTQRSMLATLDVKIPVHLEAIVRSDCALDVSNPSIYDQIENEILAHIKSSTNIFSINLSISVDTNERLWEVLDSLTVSDIVAPASKTSISYWQANLLVHIFRLSEQECEKDYLDGGEDGGDDLPASEQWELPNKHLGMPDHAYHLAVSLFSLDHMYA